MPWQIIADCPHCRTGGGLLQVMDPSHPACHLGVPQSSDCRMCGYSQGPEAAEFQPRDPIGSNRCPACRKPLQEGAHESHTCAHCDYTVTLTRTPGLDLTDEQAIRSALTAWAKDEGLSLDELCEGSLNGSTEQVIGRYLGGEPVESTLDAIAFLFPGMAAGTAVGVQVQPSTETEVSSPPERISDSRAPARLLVSVMVADGQIRVGERAFVDAFLEREGLSPLSAPDLRPWRPHEVGPLLDQGLAERTIETAVALMHLDGERDGSELRIVRSFARSWGVPDAQLDRWNRTYDRRYAPTFSVVWRTLSRWVRTH